jgi:hemolysin III
MPELNDALYYREERINAWTHGAGIVMALIALPFLVGAAQDGKLLAGAWIFAGSMILLYTASTLYHSIHEPRWKALLHRLDHICIYLLIAGSHTPFVLRYLEGSLLNGYLAVLWGLALLGTLYKLFLFHKWKYLSLALYVLMGWMVVFVMPTLLQVMDPICFRWIIIGGVSYTIGVVFFVWETLPYSHGVWHLFVLGGTLSHCIALYQILPG